MGMFFSTIHIQNKGQANPEEFKKMLCKHMEKRGFVPTDEENAQFSYRLAFSDKSGWVTLSMPGYELNTNWTPEDAQELAKGLKTHCLVTHIIDSDILSIDLFGSTDKQRDQINIGHLDYGLTESKGDPKLWNPLLAEGATWEQIEEVYNGKYTFIEEALTKIAPLLAMDSETATRVYEDWDRIPDNPNIIDLHLKKADKKSISLNAAFKKIFGEALEPLGFVKIKGKQPYFVRLIDNEILHIVTYMPRPDKHFVIKGGVATVYRPRLSLDTSPSTNMNWLHGNLHFYRKLHLSDENTKYSFGELYEFYYDEETLIDEVKYSLKITEEIMLPILDKVVDLNACIEFFHTFGGDMNLSYDIKDLSKKSGANVYNEGLLYVKANKYDAFIKRMQNSLDKNPERNEKMRKDISEVWQKHKAFLDEIYTAPELYAKVSAELEQRKIANTEILRSYGFDL